MIIGKVTDEDTEIHHFGFFCYTLFHFLDKRKEKEYTSCSEFTDVNQIYFSRSNHKCQNAKSLQPPLASFISRNGVKRTKRTSELHRGDTGKKKLNNSTPKRQRPQRTMRTVTQVVSEPRHLFQIRHTLIRWWRWLSSRRSNRLMLPWLSAHPDNKEGRFVQAGNSFFLSPKIHVLKDSTKWILLCMGMEAGGKRNFKFTRSAAKKYGISESTLRRGVDELILRGFLEVSSGYNTKTPNEYRFSFSWKESDHTISVALPK